MIEDRMAGKPVQNFKWPRIDELQQRLIELDPDVMRLCKEAEYYRHLRAGGKLAIIQIGETPDESTVLTGSDADDAIDEALNR